MFTTGPLLITAPLLLKKQPCTNSYIIKIIIIVFIVRLSESPTYPGYDIAGFNCNSYSKDVP